MWRLNFGEGMRWVQMCVGWWTTIQQHQSSFGSLLRDYRLNRIVDIIKVFLENRIFELELKAKIVFPKLFQLFPARDIQRIVLKNNAARSEAEALEKIIFLENKNDKKNENCQNKNVVNNKILI
jgi:hypothetical protein